MKNLTPILFSIMMCLGASVKAENLSSANNPNASIPQTSTEIQARTQGVNDPDQNVSKKEQGSIEKQNQIQDKLDANADPVVIYVSSGVILVLLIILLIILL